MKQTRYLVYNITRKPPKMCPKTGRDLRTTREKVGYSVKIGHNQIIVAGGRPKLVDKITEGMLALADPMYGCIRIEQCDDVMNALKQHTWPQQAASKVRAPVVAKEGAPRPGMSAQPKIVEMGQDKHDQRGGAEHEGAINPSGDPNFLVRAPAGNQHGRQIGKVGEASAAG